MDVEKLQDTRAFYESSYGYEKLGAQRRWPNEEFCRFMGRNFFSKDVLERRTVKILEVGCGTGSNLRLLTEEGFAAYGIELSNEAIKLMPLLLGKDMDNCKVVCGNMMKLPWVDEMFQAIVDIFSSYCLDETDFIIFVDEVYRTLEKGGKYFSYTPSKGAEAFKNYDPAKKIDSSTLDGIHRETSPYYGNFYPFRFMGVEDVRRFFDKERFEVTYLEKVSRTYSCMEEMFEFLVFEVTKL